MKLNRAAWSILSPDEKTALGTMHGMNKSSWEAGEIMDKSHYKFLEIKYRAEKFLALFTEHLELYQELIPSYVMGELTVIKYFKWCIGERLKPMEAIDRLNDNTIDKVYTKSALNEKIITQLRKWGSSDDVYQLSMYNLVKEFDRWNNFRILPREIQEPSAFKRRIKNMYKKHIRALTEMNDLSKTKLKELIKPGKQKIYYLPMLVDKKGYEIWRAKLTNTISPLYNELCLYVFKTKEEADKYIYNVFQYVNKEKKDCKDGIIFWQIYRDCIKTAINYNEVQKISATRSHLEIATNKLEYF